MTSLAHEPTSPRSTTAWGVVREDEISHRDVEASWSDWAAGADLADEPAVALTLFAARPTDEDGPAELEGAAFDQARLELLSGHPDRALAALARAGLVELAAAPADDPRAALLAACRAAAGDAQAYRWLLAGLRNPDWAGTWTAAYVVAAAAEARGDLPTADEMWWRAVTTHGIRTRLSLQRAAVATVWRRDRDDAGASCSALIEAAGLLDSVPLGVGADPDIALEAAAALLTRGDAQGAVLLLRAVDRCTASHPRVVAELDRLAPPAPRRRQDLIGLALAAVPAFGSAVVGVLSGTPVLGVPVALAAVVGHAIWHDRCALPGLDREASGAYRALGTLEHEVRDGVVRLQPVKDQRGAYGAAAIGALIPAGVLGSQLVAGMDALGLGQVAGGSLTGAVWVLVLVAGLVGGFLGSRALHRHRVSRRRERETASAHRARARALSRCACFETPVVTGAFVAEFRRSHLRPTGPDGPAASAVAGRLGARADLAFCPTTGHLWLQPLRAHGQPLLLRGAVAAGGPVEDVRPSTVPTGFYL